jgi:hypothetical protein
VKQAAAARAVDSAAPDGLDEVAATPVTPAAPVTAAAVVRGGQASAENSLSAPAPTESPKTGPPSRPLLPEPALPALPAPSTGNSGGSGNSGGRAGDNIVVQDTTAIVSRIVENTVAATPTAPPGAGGLYTQQPVDEGGSLSDLRGLRGGGGVQPRPQTPNDPAGQAVANGRQGRSMPSSCSSPWSPRVASSPVTVQPRPRRTSSAPQAPAPAIAAGPIDFSTVLSVKHAGATRTGTASPRPARRRG